jgi:predicted nuclease of predicted toxin-antitoxin system
MKVLVDMNLSPTWATFLSEAGIPATHWSNIGPVDAPDRSLMAHAVANGFVVLTQDLDFGAILAASKAPGPSVVQIRSDDLNIASIGSTVLAALRLAKSELLEGALITVEPGKTQLRILPLIRD